MGDHTTYEHERCHSPWHAGTGLMYFLENEIAPMRHVLADECVGKSNCQPDKWQGQEEPTV